MGVKGFGAIIWSWHFLSLIICGRDRAISGLMTASSGWKSSQWLSVFAPTLAMTVDHNGTGLILRLANYLIERVMFAKKRQNISDFPHV